ncbi:MAG: class I SAM-dependent methyltransferase [Actinomycetota bacterium]|nr:class I SAM-dependent methyltransferase [Actinomycetota bacterium]
MDATPEADDELDAALARIRARIDERRRSGDYPIGLNQELTTQFERMAAAGHVAARERAASAIDRLRMGPQLSLDRIPTGSRMPGGEAAHRTVKKVVGRQMVGLLQQVDEFRAETTNALESLLEAVGDADGSSAGPDAGVQTAGLLDRLAHVEQLTEVVREVDGRLHRLEERLAAPIDDQLYAAIEERFRGTREQILERLRLYVMPAQRTTSPERPALDLGCGRGELLQLFRDHDVHAVGCDLNPQFAAEARLHGREVHVADLLSFLHAAADQSYGAVTMIHVAEHFSIGTFAEIMREVRRVLAPDGVFMVETPNAQNLQVASSTFWIDPTHVQPIHPQLLTFLAEYHGFDRTELVFMSRRWPPIDLDALDAEGLDPEARQLLPDAYEALGGPQDVALFAWTPSESGERTPGLSINELLPKTSDDDADGDGTGATTETFEVTAGGDTSGDGALRADGTDAG